MIETGIFDICISIRGLTPVPSRTMPGSVQVAVRLAKLARTVEQSFFIHDHVNHSILQMRKHLSSILREQNFMLFRLPNQLIADRAADRYSFGAIKLSPGFMVANGHLWELASGIGISCSIVALNFTLISSSFVLPLSVGSSSIVHPSPDFSLQPQALPTGKEINRVHNSGLGNFLLRPEVELLNTLHNLGHQLRRGQIV